MLDIAQISIFLSHAVNDGRRLKDHGEMRKGVDACRELTIQRGYCWGEHKSVSQCRSERPYERERQSMCKDIYRLAKGGTDACILQHEAAKLGITVRYRTDPKSGLIRGVSFERRGIRFQGGRMDRSLSASRILPTENQVPLTPRLRERLVTPEVEKLLKAGGVAPNVNNHKVLEPVPPPAPRYEKSKDIGARHRAEVARKESLAKDKGQKLTQSEQPRQTERQEVKQSRGMRR